jgi:glc operon protein GlcG
MPATRAALKLNHDTALQLVRAAADKAIAIGVAQVIVVVDEGCNMLAFLRMDGGRVLSAESATRKAMTSAVTGQPTGGLGAEAELRLGLATSGKITNLKGGLPLVVEGHLVGGIGVGSGTGEQDLSCAQAAVDLLATLR